MSYLLHYTKFNVKMTRRFERSYEKMKKNKNKNQAHQSIPFSEEKYQSFLA